MILVTKRFWKTGSERSAVPLTASRGGGCVCPQPVAGSAEGHVHYRKQQTAALQRGRHPKKDIQQNELSGGASQASVVFLVFSLSFFFFLF